MTLSVVCDALAADPMSLPGATTHPPGGGSR